MRVLATAVHLCHHAEPVLSGKAQGRAGIAAQGRAQRSQTILVSNFTLQSSDDRRAGKSPQT
ncbi:Aldehyde dehydrogenase [Carbonactinospora thermoautotrophica]|uniref:Aldehyde dehydrogenase n=1 Tax=Carbonactinospora thermoautotrophica TaxID=1469144 RepID=A0A132MXH6_9ACTN|nr:Aldehyde dehydrogenase [Carbonactinospora thermoautotrophica]